MAGPVISFISGILSGELHNLVKIVDLEIVSEEENKIVVELITASAKQIRITVEEIG